MLEIKNQKIKDETEIQVPGSKSYTHRILITSALSDGICKIDNPLISEDTLLTMKALRDMGVKIDQSKDQVMVKGTNGKLGSCEDPIYLANSGTSMRLLTAVACIGEGTYTLTGTDRMHERPIQDLIDGLRQLGSNIHSQYNNGCPPVIIEGRTIKGGKAWLDCSKSSQYLSALLLVGPYLPQDLTVQIAGGLVSKPYVDMTIEVMKKMGVDLTNESYEWFKVNAGDSYKAGEYTVEPDCSQAGYFWTAAAITGASIKVKHIHKTTSQGDVRYTKILEAMGCQVIHANDGITVKGDTLQGVETDMKDMPDIVPTLAVAAAFAKGTTRIKNVSHLKEKESDRLGSVVNELKKMGIEAECDDSGMTIKGGEPHGAEIDTYDDHRMAMSFALAGLKIPGVKIKNETCVEKSFPEYWDVFNSMYVA